MLMRLPLMSHRAPEGETRFWQHDRDIGCAQKDLKHVQCQKTPNGSAWLHRKHNSEPLLVSEMPKGPMWKQATTDPIIQQHQGPRNESSCTRKFSTAEHNFSLKVSQKLPVPAVSTEIQPLVHLSPVVALPLTRGAYPVERVETTVLDRASRSEAPIAIQTTPTKLVNNSSHVVFDTGPPFQADLVECLSSSPSSHMTSKHSENEFDKYPSWSSDRNLAFSKEWQQIKGLHLYILGVRFRVQQARKILRDHQRNKSVAEDQFFQRVQRQELETPNPKLRRKPSRSMLQLMEQYQKERDAYGPLEDDCNSMENQLYDLEFDLLRRQEHIFARLDAFSDMEIGQSDTVNSQPLPAADYSSDEDEGPVYPPSVINYLSKKGSLGLMRERYDDIQDEREVLEDRSKSRRRVGLQLPDEEQQWLDESGELQDEVANKIRLLEIEVEELKSKCVLDGLVGEDGEPTGFHDRELGQFKQEEAMDSGSQVSEYSRFPALLTQREGRSGPPIFNPNPEEAKSSSLTRRVDSWLLERLRISPLDVYLLSSTYEGQGGELSEYWPSAVLQCWFEDEASKGGTPLQMSNSSLSTKVPRAAETSENSSDTGISDVRLHSHLRSLLTASPEYHRDAEVTGNHGISYLDPPVRLPWRSL